MNTATQSAPITVQALQTNTPQHEGRDPMETRWGVNTCVREKLLEGGRAGFSVLPYGKFFPISRFTTPEEVHSTDPYIERERMVTKSAESVESYLKEMLAGLDAYGIPEAGKSDFGFRAGFYGELDASKMAVISATILPSLSTIRGICQELGLLNPIGAVCEGQDNMDFEDRQSCPTCWLRWLKSDACDAYIHYIAQTGMPVREISGSQEQSRTVRPSIKELAEAQSIALTSLQTGIASLAKDWLTISQELEKGERKDVNTFQHGIRKDLHEIKPQDRQLHVIREYGKAASGGNVPAVSGSVEQAIAMLANSQVQTATLLASIADKVGISAAPPAVPVAVPLTVNEAAVPLTVGTQEAATNTEDDGELSPAVLEMLGKQ